MHPTESTHSPRKGNVGDYTQPSRGPGHTPEVPPLRSPGGPRHIPVWGWVTIVSIAALALIYAVASL